jgi:ubiquinone/menaquinone biosynthesis C-methylase UbiE
MGFDLLAPHYDWLEALTAGQRLQRARTTWLEELRGCRRILSVGEGHGKFAEACAAKFPDAELTCVEDSKKMLARARTRLAASPAKINWVEADVFQWTPTGKYDAIVTCFFLDCFTAEQLATVIRKLRDSAAPGAAWIVVDFSIPASGLARWRAQVVHALMYGFFRVATSLPARRMTAPDGLLRAQGFRREGRREWEWGLLRADLWRLG